MQTQNFSYWLNPRDAWFGIRPKHESCRGICVLTNSQTMIYLKIAIEIYKPTKLVIKMEGNESWVKSVTLAPPPLLLLTECTRRCQIDTN